MINVALLVMLALVVLLATIDLSWIILKGVLTPPVFLLDVEELLELFGAFLLVLIGVELLGTIKTFLAKNYSCRSCSAGEHHRHRPQGRDSGTETNGGTEARWYRRDHRCANLRLLLRQTGRSKDTPI